MVGEIRRRFSAPQVRTPSPLSPYPKPQAFFLFSADFSLSFARKKEKPPSGFNLTSAVQEKGWLLLTQQTTQVELKEKPPSGLKLTAAGS